jgi:hypothetical protein
MVLHRTRHLCMRQQISVIKQYVPILPSSPLLRSPERSPRNVMAPRPRKIYLRCLGRGIHSCDNGNSRYLEMGVPDRRRNKNRQDGNET